MFLRLAFKSLMYRKASVVFIMFAMIVSVMVLLGVEHIRHQAKKHFANTVSGVDLIVGARTGQTNLLLYSVFRLGLANNNISWQAFNNIKHHQQVEWAVPISLGDSHKGYSVVATNKDYFEHFKYGQQHPLKFDQGRPFSQPFELVLGADVARNLHYQLGDPLYLSHGLAATSFQQHQTHAFTVVGILAPTGTPIDQSLHVTLQGIEAIHQPHIPKDNASALQPQTITAVFVGLKSKLATFSVQRFVNHHTAEPLLAIIPGIALTHMWQSMSVIEDVLRLISTLVFCASLLGLSAMLMATIQSRHQEIQLLRLVGASPRFLFFFIQFEALLLTIASILCAYILLFFTLSVAQGMLLAKFTLNIEVNVFNQQSLTLLAWLILYSQIAALIPAMYAFYFARRVS